MSIYSTSANLQLDTKRHSFAHLMACAVQIYFKELAMAENTKNQKSGNSSDSPVGNSQVQFGVGPVIDNGCYYDFILPRPLVPEDLPKIEKTIRKLLKQDLRFERIEVDLEEAMEIFKQANQPLKIELLENLRDKGTTSLSEEEKADLGVGNEVKSPSYGESFKEQEVEIRKGELADLNLILEIQKNGWKDICQEALNITTEDVDYLFENNFAKNPHKNFVVACISEKIIGIVCIGEDGEIHGFFVDSAYREKGVGKKLLDFIIPEIKIKFGEIKVGSLVKNTKATQFYKNYGFVQNGTREISLDLKDKKYLAEEEILILPESKVLEILNKNKEKADFEVENEAKNSPREGWQPEADGVFSTQEKFSKYKNLPYNPKLAEKAKALRKAGVLSEVLFWEKVKNKQLQALDFERQKIIGNYIVDFYCPELGLVIEIDGESHDFKRDYDQEREGFLKNLGLNVVHFEDARIKKDLDNVMSEVYDLTIKSKNNPSSLCSDTPQEGNLLNLNHQSQNKNLPTITLYRLINNKTGEILFEDLCKGPHVESLAEFGDLGFALDKFSASYWRADQARGINMQRLYALVFETKEELETFKTVREEAKKFDHRVLGQELDLFSFSDLVGSGLPLFSPKGTLLRNTLKAMLFQVSKSYGCQEVTIPHMARLELYETSGHAKKFAGELFHVKSHYDIDFVLKPVNCPHHTQIFASKMRSYRDLPLRYIESTMQYRDEKPGAIGGLTRVRSITCDDGHTFCTPDQIKGEILSLCKTIEEFYTNLGMYGNHWVSISVRDYQNLDNYTGFQEDWDKAENMLKEINQELGLNGKVCEGEAAIYGPKLDFMYKDIAGNERQLSTVQLDFATPKRFGLTYKEADGSERPPVMIHRAILGSYERFLAILLESTKGRFPFWLSPVQLKILTINNQPEVLEYVEKIKAILNQTVLMKPLKYNEIRFEVDDRQESLGKKIREGEMAKIPVLLIVGPKDILENQVSVRTQGGEEKIGLEGLEGFLKSLK